jgi:hypothetical protein
MDAWLRLALWLHAGLVRLLPPGFQDDFAREMRADFSILAREAARAGPAHLARLLLRELRDLPSVLAREYRPSRLSARSQTHGTGARNGLLKEGKMSDEPVPNKDQALPYSAALAGILPLLNFGLFTIYHELPQEVLSQPGLRVLNGWWFLFTFLVLPAVGFALGWIKGFPTWSYPYTAQAYLFSLYISVASTPGIEVFGYPLFGRQMWGGRAWFPMMAAVLVALLVTRAPLSFLKLFTNIARDWTQATFGLFGLMPFVAWVLFDEIDRAYSLPFMALICLITCGAAWFYLRAARQGTRAWSLLAGALLTLLAAGLGPWYYGRLVGARWVYIPGMLVFAVVVLAILFSPALIALIKSLSRPSQTT